MIHPEILFIRYSPTSRKTPYRTAAIIDHSLAGRMAFRDDAEEERNRPKLLAAMEAAWLDGARVILLLGNEAFKAFGYSGAFRDYRGTWLEPQGLSSRPWLVMATIDPGSKAAYIRNGYETYKSDLAKALRGAQSGAPEIRESFTTGPDMNKILAWIKAILPDAVIACDIETDGLSAHKGCEPVCIGIARSKDEALVIPWRRGRGMSYWSGTEETLLLQELKRLFATHRSVWHNGIFFDIPFLILSGFPLGPFAEYVDTIMMHRAIEPEAPHSLAYVASRYSTKPYWKDDFKNRPGSIYAMDPDKLWTYNARDAVTTLEVYEAMLDKLPDEFSMAAAPLVIMKALHEIRIDQFDQENLQRELRHELSETETKLKALAELPPDFSFSSPVHINAFVFNAKRVAAERSVVDRYSAKASELEARIARFNEDHLGWSDARREKELARYRQMLERLETIGVYAQAKAHLALMAGIRPLYDVSRLSYLPRIKPGGLYSFDSLSREKLVHQLKRRSEQLSAKITAWAGDPAKKTFAARATEELEQITKLLAWLALYEYRQNLTSLSQLALSQDDIMSMPLEALRRFGRHIKPGLAARFYTIKAPPSGFTAEDLSELARKISSIPHTFVILIRKECVIIETPEAGSASFRWDQYGETLAEALKEDPDVDP